MDSASWRTKRELPAVNGAGPQSKSYWRDDNRSSSKLPSNWDSRRQDQSSRRQPLNNEESSSAIDAGRRLYVGNMPYKATLQDVEAHFSAISSDITAINISIDPMTSRNPSYCFIDLRSAAIAASVMESYNGSLFLGRELRVKPGVKPGSGTGRFHMPARKTHDMPSPPVFDRWRRLDAALHHRGVAAQGRRLFIGGLPRFIDQPETNAAIRKLFSDEGFEIEAVSKQIRAPKKDVYGMDGEYYCFVDVRSAEEAKEALAVLHGSEKWETLLRVQFAKNNSMKIVELDERHGKGMGTSPAAEER